MYAFMSVWIYVCMYRCVLPERRSMRPSPVCTTCISVCHMYGVCQLYECVFYMCTRLPVYMCVILLCVAPIDMYLCIPLFCHGVDLPPVSWVCAYRLYMNEHHFMYCPPPTHEHTDPLKEWVNEWMGGGGPRMAVEIFRFLGRNANIWHQLF